MLGLSRKVLRVKPYLDLLREVLEKGERRPDRTGTGTLSLFGTHSRYDLRYGFPLVTTKKVNFSLVVRELLWFLSGSTNVNDLVGAEQLWRPWADSLGNLGPIYSRQWRDWGAAYDFDYLVDVPGVDQISRVIASIKNDPNGRRHIVSAWNVSDIPAMALPPCHVLHQYYVSQDGFLDMQMYQRSADLAIGVPFNVASYALLLSMVARECSLLPRYLIHAIGDAHIYQNHISGIEEQLKREPRELPLLALSGNEVLTFKEEDIYLFGYDPHPFIKFEVAV